jgi:hypothetical protein
MPIFRMRPKRALALGFRGGTAYGGTRSGARRVQRFHGFRSSSRLAAFTSSASCASLVALAMEA